MGTAAGGVDRILSQHQVLLERGPDRVSPMFLPHFLPDSASGLVAIALGAEGPNMAVAQRVRNGQPRGRRSVQDRSCATTPT